MPLWRAVLKLHKTVGRRRSGSVEDTVGLCMSGLLEVLVKSVKRLAKLVQKNQRVKYVIICFTTAFILTSGNLLYYGDISSEDFHYTDEKTHQSNVERFRNCLLRSNSLWSQLREIVRDCNMQHTKIRSQFTIILPRGSTGEQKSFLPYRNKAGTSEPDSSDCTSLTIGIGNEITAEHHLLARYPKCQLNGVDPVVDAGEAFIRLGTYFPVGISAAGGEKQMETKFANGSNLMATVKTVTFAQLLHDYVKVPLAHFVSLDVDGEEMEILSDLNSLKPATFCQLEVKFYGNRWASPSIFDQFLREFLQSTDYVVIAAGLQLGQTCRITLVNWRERSCVKRFDLDYLLSPPEII